jgi:hypothetical protein
MQADEVAQLALQCLGRAGERGDAFDLLACDTHPTGLWHRSQPASDPVELAGVVELAGSSRGAVYRGTGDTSPHPVRTFVIIQAWACQA